MLYISFNKLQFSFMCKLDIKYINCLHFTKVTKAVIVMSLKFQSVQQKTHTLLVG